MSGAAPGAKIVSVRACLFIAGCTAHALLEGMIYAAKQANVDVINMSIGGLPALNDGNNARCIVYNAPDRAVERADVHLRRQQRLGHEHRRRPERVQQGDERRLVHHEGRRGSRTTAPTRPSPTTCTASARAARARTAASSRASSRRGRRSRPTPLWQPGGPVAGTYALPPGYSMLNGTSMASPAGGGRGGAADQRGEAAGCPEAAGSAPPGADLLGSRSSTRPASASTSRATA